MVYKMDKYKVIFKYIVGYVDGRIIFNEDYLVLEAISYKNAEIKFKKYCTGTLIDIEMVVI